MADSDRITELEVRSKYLDSMLQEIRSEHRSEIRALREVTERLERGFSEISQTLRSVKWGIFGAIGFAAVEQFGLVALLRKIF